MTSEKQLEANRQNAKRSTGPKTVEGKLVSSKNAVKHGLLSSEAVIKGEDYKEFQAFRDCLISDLKPVGELEDLLSDRIVASFWKLRRAGRIENSLFNVLIDDYEDLGIVVRDDFAESNILSRFQRYESEIERSLFKALNELQKLQYLRKRNEAILSESYGIDSDGNPN